MKSCRQKNRGVLVFLLSDGESVIRNLAGVMRAAKERGWRTQIAPGALLREDDGLHFALAPTGGNVTVRTTATQGRVTIATAHSFDGAENLESWTVAASGNRPGSVLLSDDGKSLYLSLVSPTVIFFR